METVAGGDRVLYLYGVIPRGQSLPAAAGAELQAVVPSAQSAIAALVEPVCAQEFSSDSLDEKLASIEWVSRWARRHEAVLEDATRHGAVVPARLCTLFSSAEALRLSLAANEEGFLAALEWVQDREEWGLKMFCAEGRLREIGGREDPQARALEAAMANASPGHAFVLRKKRDARLAEIAAARIEEVIEETIDALEHETADMRLLRALLSAATEATGSDGGPMVLNLATLVDRTSREVFHSAVAQLSERFRNEGFTFQVSGPWPPYSFCTEEEEE